MKLSILISTFILSPLFLMAQYSSDALLFSETQPFITARSMSLGNALGALGADLSVANTNPAGLGVYRRTELGLSLGSLSNDIKSDFKNGRTTTRARSSKMMFGGLGIVVATPLSRFSDWKFINVGFSINRLANYYQKIEFDGISEGSRLLSFADAAYGIDPQDLNPYESALAYDSYLIDQDAISPQNYISAVIPSDIIRKSQTIERKGGVNELGFSVAGNYKNKLYMGATLGVDFLTMEEDKYYTELATNDTIAFEEMQYSEFRKITGTGINLKLGMIYRVNKAFRFGLAVHTPTAYRIKETFDTEMYAKVYYNNVLQENTLQPAEIQEIEHDLATPWVFSGSLGLIIAKKGFLGAEVSYQDYSLSEFSLLENDRNTSNNEYMRNVNQAIGKNYKGTFNFKVGGELNLGVTRLRLGYRLQTSPYQTEADGVNDLRHDISAGVGFRWKHFFLDFGYVHTLREFEYIPYRSNQLQTVVGKQQTGQAMITLGASIFSD